MKYRIAALAAALAAATACDSTGPDFSTYTLTEVNGQALPATLPGDSIEVLGGEFEFRDRGDIDEWHRYRCRETLPPGTTCLVERDGSVQRLMRFNALENRAYYGDGAWYPMEISADTAAITFQVEPLVVFRYEKLQ